METRVFGTSVKSEEESILPQRLMNFLVLLTATLLCGATARASDVPPVIGPPEATTREGKTWRAVEDIIAKAHEYDINYAPKESVDRNKAIAGYEKAMAAGADYSQRLHVLFRLAQLHGTSYDKTIGEKPDYPTAIRYCKMIVEEYPQWEPLAVKALNTIASYHLAGRQPEVALDWFKQSLQFDVNALETSIPEAKVPPGAPPSMNARSELYPEADTSRMSEAQAHQQVERIKVYQATAVKSIGDISWRISPELFAAEMKGIIDRHPNTYVAQLASDRLKSVDLNRQLPKDIDRLGGAKTTTTVPGAGVATPPSPNVALAPAWSLAFYVLTTAAVLAALVFLMLKLKRKDRHP